MNNQQYVEFEGLKVGTILFNKYRTYSLITKKSPKKVWFLSFELNEKPREFWRRNCGDTDSYDFYYPEEIGYLAESRIHLRSIIKRCFNK